MKKNWIIYTLSIIALALIIYACAVNPVTGKKEFNLMSEKQEKALGAQSDPSIIANFGLYDDEKIQQFITEKGEAMAKISHRPELDFKFRVLDSEVVNAFAVPGGYVYFTRGILAHFNNEAEFAGVLGHEIGHVTARHSAKQYSNQILTQALFIGGMIASKEVRKYAEDLSQGLGLLMLKNSRDHESQSDQLGVEYSTKIGYNSHHMANFFRTINRISEKAGQRIPTFLSTHPDPLDRYDKVHQMSDEWQKKTGTANLKVNRDPYLRMIDGIIYGEDPKQGFVENNMFYHPVLKFQFPVPRGWQYQNSPVQFVMAPESGKAMVQLTLGEGKSLDEAANSFVQKYSLTVRQSRKGTVNGIPALIMTADQVPDPQQGQEQQTIRLLNYFIQYNDLIYQFNGIAALEDFTSYVNTFESVMGNFEECKDPDKLNRQPERIKIEEVANDGTLQQALNHYRMPSDRQEELAILNGMQLTDQVEKGALIKTIGK